MEHIQRALEVASRTNSEDKKKNIIQPSFRGKTGTQLTEFNYSKTKVCPVAYEELRKNRVLVGDDTDDAVVAYRMLRTQILQRMSAKRWNALAVTSPTPGNGKTLTAINLAISLAREVHRTVLLADFDLRKPSLQRYFGLEPTYGINDYLTGHIPLHDVLINPGIDRLVLLPGRESVYNSSEMLSSPMMMKLVDELKSRYPSRFIIFDLPPLLSTDDTLAFSPYVDAVLMVIEEGKTRKDDLHHAMGLLQSTNVIGTVLNKSEDTNGGYY